MHSDQAHSATTVRVARVLATAPRILVALHDAREEIVAGFGNTLLVVRTLDGLSCTLHAGELLRLAGGIASGARSLLNAFDESRSRIQVQRRISTGVRIRRACVPAVAERAIVAGWSDGDARCSAGASAVDGSVWSGASVVYLLRIRDGMHRQSTSERSAQSPVVNVHAWRTWAATVRREGGAIVLAGGEHSLSRALPCSDAATNGRSDKQRAGESDPLPINNRVRETPTARSGGVRTLTLHAGRIVGERSDSIQE